MFVKSKQFKEMAIEVQSYRRDPDGTLVIHGCFWKTEPVLHLIGNTLKLKISPAAFNDWAISNTLLNEQFVWEEFKL